MEASNLRDLLAVVVEMAPRLREAGVGTVEAAGLKVTLVPAPIVLPQPMKHSRQLEHEAALEAVIGLSNRRGASGQ